MIDRTNSRIAQVYGYAVCFITVIMILVSLILFVVPWRWLRERDTLPASTV